MRRSHYTRRLVAFVGAAVLLFGVSACAADSEIEVELPTQVDAALPDDTQAQLQAAMDRAIAATGSSGAIVGVWAPWAGSWVTGIGTSTPDGEPVTTDMTFKAGATTRAMTCDVLYALAAEGTVNLDDAVTDWVRGVPMDSEISLGELCDSTAGLGSYTDRLTGRMLANPARNWNPRELLAYGTAQGIGGDSGATFRDSSTGYLLLGLALENASGMSAAALYEDYIAQPLGLTQTQLASTSTSTLHGLLSGDVDGAVACAAPTDVTGLSPSAGFTASGVETDVTELGRYVQALAIGARAYDDDARFESPLPVVADGPAWFTASGGAYQAGDLIGQYGSVPGYLTAAFADKNTGMSVVVVLNNSRAGADVARVLAWELAAVVSKVPAAAGQSAPEAGLPWTAEDMSAQLAAAAVCPIP
ncbi:serine hydrolase domain-containing protein [Microbacterium memoriense]|uniref:Beta-lactamase family protein n=1 Tax=Microbacterium memoriense TaxID=2978350 RepID=A0ABT2PEG6_9MICO|nr:serine hydrolase domain-containing protein [Microbacterium memoriense]MCT9003003.1 beta-lactamase family protein [Microbacterium memoriense]